MRPDRWCEGPGCSASIAFLAPRAKYCSGRCTKAASRTRKSDRLGHRHGYLGDQRGFFPALDANRGYLPDGWKPQRVEGQIMLAQAQNILEEYRGLIGDVPLTCRQIYYRMIAEYRHPKGSKFERALYSILEDARRARQIPFSSIRDDGVSGGGYWPTHPSQLLAGWRLQAQNFERDVQQGQPVRVQVWCESVGMRPQLARVSDLFCVPVYSCGGFDSLTAKQMIVSSVIDDLQVYGTKTVLLHLGDCDPSGYSIFQSVVEDVASFLEGEGHDHEELFAAERVALNLDQMEAFGVETDPVSTNPKDTRARTWRRQGLTRQAQLEALAPDKIATLLTEAIGRHLDQDIIEVIRAEQVGNRRALIGAAGAAKRKLEPAHVRVEKRHQHLLDTLSRLAEQGR
jgi:hypothetical protein